MTDVHDEVPSSVYNRSVMLLLIELPRNNLRTPEYILLEKSCRVVCVSTYVPQFARVAHCCMFS